MIRRLGRNGAGVANGRDLVEDVVECCTLARAGRAEQEQVSVHLPVEPVQRIESDGAATAVEHRDTRMAGALAAAPDGCQVGGVLGEHQLRVPLALVLGRVEHAGKPAQVAVQRRDFVFFAHRLQAGVEHDVCQLQTACVEFAQVAPAQVERQCSTIELVRTADDAAGFVNVLPGLLGCQRLTDCFLAQVVEVGLEHVLRRGDDRQAHHRVLGHLVEQGIDGVAALARFAGQVSDARWHAQPVHWHDPVRHAIEMPDTVLDVGMRLAEEQALREVGATGQLNFTGFRFFWVRSQGVEAFPVGRRCTKRRGVGVEPTQQPVVHVGRGQAPRTHTGVGQPAQQPIADDCQGMLGDCPRRSGVAEVRR